MLDGLVEVMYPNHPDPAGNSIVTETTGYKNCEISDSVNLPFRVDSVLDNFDDEIQKFSVAPFIRMTDFIDRFFIDEELGNEINRIHLVRQLKDLIQNDDTILQQNQFYLVKERKAVHKAEFCGMTQISLASFLLAVWHFILMNRPDNTVGQETIKRWFPDGYTGSLQIADKDLGKTIAQDIDIRLLNDEFADQNVSETITRDQENGSSFSDDDIIDAGIDSNENADSERKLHSRIGMGTEKNRSDTEEKSQRGMEQNYYGPAMTFNFNGPVNGFVAHADKVENNYGEKKRGKPE